MRQKVITKYVRFFITKCDSYYKMRRLLQIATVQLLLKASKAHNKYLIPLLYLLINCILAKSTSQILPLIWHKIYTTASRFFMKKLVYH